MLAAFILFAPPESDLAVDLFSESSLDGRYLIERRPPELTLSGDDGIVSIEAERSEHRPQTWLVYNAGSTVPRVALLSQVQRAAHDAGFDYTSVPESGSMLPIRLVFQAGEATLALSPDPEAPGSGAGGAQVEVLAFESVAYLTLAGSGLLLVVHR